MAYDPTIGRFIQRDPIGYDDGMNLYQFVGGNPVNRVDPLGLAGQPATAPTSQPSTQPAPAAPYDEIHDLWERMKWDASQPAPKYQKQLLEKLTKAFDNKFGVIAGVGRGEVEFSGFNGPQSKYLKEFDIIPDDNSAPNFAPPSDGTYDVDGVILPDSTRPGEWLKIPDWRADVNPKDLGPAKKSGHARIIYICENGVPGYEVQTFGNVTLTTEAVHGNPASAGGRGTGAVKAPPIKQGKFKNP